MPSKSLGLFPASLSPDPLFCLEFVEITNKIETCLVAVAVAEARPRQMNMKPTREMTFLIGRTKILHAPVTVSRSGRPMSAHFRLGLWGTLRVDMSHVSQEKTSLMFVTLFPTRLFERVQYSLMTSSQSITIEQLTNNAQSNQTNKKRKNSSDIVFLVITIYFKYFEGEFW